MTQKNEKTKSVFFGECFVKLLRSFAKRRLENLKNDSQRRCDRNRQKIIEIEAILVIFRFEIHMFCVLFPKLDPNYLPLYETTV